ncbi:MAG: folylpolyglutamate synthase/dihydrofolate synthase family protein [Planctomycetota bacterium]
MNYETHSRVSYTNNNFSLARMNRLLAALGNPHRKFASVHIAGTKGKGSTATMVAEMLRGTGYKVGLYTSPHVSTICERIWVDGRIIPETAFTQIFRQVAPVARSIKGVEPTYFELLTAGAFLHFAQAKVEIAVIETGMGGRLDATNVLTPAACGITSISYDHAAQLGNTLELIAGEKAGIIKKGVPVVSAPQAPSVKKVLQQVAEERSAPIYFVGQDVPFSHRFESAPDIGPHNRISLTTPQSRFEHLHVPLSGEHQTVNCALSLVLLDVLKGRGFTIDDQKAVAGLANVRMVGRMEIISDEPRILVDGAHNAASIEALMRAIGQSVRYDSMVVIFGCHKDKDIDGMLKQLQLGADKIVFTSTGSRRAVDADEVAARYTELSGKMAQVGRTLDEAMAIAASAVSREDIICITGSFYLVGEAKKRFTQL